MVNESERRLILGMIQGGKITAEEGLRLLKALDSADDYLEAGEDIVSTIEFVSEHQPAIRMAAGDSPSQPGAASHDNTQGEPVVGEVIDEAPGAPDFNRWRRFWVIPFWVGVGVTVLAGVLMYQAQQSFGLGLWFYCSWLPFLIGIVMMVLSWQSRTTRWLHLRVQQRPGEHPQNINISFPLPLRAAAWLARTFRGKIPGLDNTSLDELVTALGESTTSDNPLYIEVDEGDDGERVQIFIG